MFVATKQEMVSEAQTRALNAPDTNFQSGSGATKNGAKPSKT